MQNIFKDRFTRTVLIQVYAMQPHCVITHDGTFQSKYLVYGAKLTFEKSKKIIEQTIAGYLGTKSISGDILIWSSSIGEIKKGLDELFDIIAKNGLKADSRVV